MKTFKVTRIESAEYSIEIKADTHEQAEAYAKNRAETEWTQRGFFMDYTPLLMDEGER